MAEWHTYVLVSSDMPKGILIGIAREAAQADAVVVLNGFPGTQNSLPEAQRFVAGINAACCSRERPSRWVIDPRIAQRYGVRTVPGYVIARGNDTKDFSAISGDMDLTNALKAFAQRSHIPAARSYASGLYQRAFAEP